MSDDPRRVAAVAGGADSLWIGGPQVLTRNLLHELNNALGVALGNVSLLLDSLVGEASLMVQDTEAALRRIGALSRFASRYAASGLHPVEIDVRPMLEAVAARFARERRVEVVTHFEPDGPWRASVHLVPGCLEACVLGLLDGAIPSDGDLAVCVVHLRCLPQAQWFASDRPPGHDQPGMVDIAVDCVGTDQAARLEAAGGTQALPDEVEPEMWFVRRIVRDLGGDCWSVPPVADRPARIHLAVPVTLSPEPLSLVRAAD
jgi:hypothetical protein